MRQNRHTIPKLDHQGLRRFGLVTGALFALLFGLFFPWVLSTHVPTWPWIITVVLAIWALVAPQSLQPVYYYWMRLALLLNRFTTPIILGIVFYLLILPIGLIMRLSRPDPMARRWDDAAQSYRSASRKIARSDMEKPF